MRNETGIEHTYYLEYPGNAWIASGSDESIRDLGRRNLAAFRKSLEIGDYEKGGMLSTAPDVAGFDRALLTAEIPTETTLSRVQTSEVALDEAVTIQRGCGLDIRNLVIDDPKATTHGVWSIRRNIPSRGSRSPIRRSRARRRVKPGQDLLGPRGEEREPDPET